MAGAGPSGDVRSSDEASRRREASSFVVFFGGPAKKSVVVFLSRRRGEERAPPGRSFGQLCPCVIHVSLASWLHMGRLRGRAPEPLVHALDVEPDAATAGPARGPPPRSSSMQRWRGPPRVAPPRRSQRLDELRLLQRHRAVHHVRRAGASASPASARASALGTPRGREGVVRESTRCGSAERSDGRARDDSRPDLPPQESPRTLWFARRAVRAEPQRDARRGAARRGARGHDARARDARGGTSEPCGGAHRGRRLALAAGADPRVEQMPDDDGDAERVIVFLRVPELFAEAAEARGHRRRLVSSKPSGGFEVGGVPAPAVRSSPQHLTAEP